MGLLLYLFHGSCRVLSSEKITKITEFTKSTVLVERKSNITKYTGAFEQHNENHQNRKQNTVKSLKSLKAQRVARGRIKSWKSPKALRVRVG